MVKTETVSIGCLIFGFGLFVSFSLTTFLPLGEDIEVYIQGLFQPHYCLSEHRGIDMPYPPIED